MLDVLCRFVIIEKTFGDGRMEVRYIGKDRVGIKKGKVYEVISIEKDWYRIMTELEEDYLFPKNLFEVVED